MALVNAGSLLYIDLTFHLDKATRDSNVQQLTRKTAATSDVLGDHGDALWLAIISSGHAPCPAKGRCKVKKKVQNKFG